MRRRDTLRIVGTALAGGIAGCSFGGPADSRTIEMTDDLDFDPATVAVAQGGTVTWRNVGSVEHTVTAYEAELPDSAAYFASGGFDSESAARTRLSDGLIDADGTYEHTFETTGSYEYVCLPHESSGMDGVVRVK